MRRIGAIAGIVPAAVVLILLVAIGGLSGRLDGLAAGAGIGFAAVAIGWLAGPIARGGRADLAAVVVYAALVAVAYLVAGTVASLASFVPVGPRLPVDLVVDFLARFGYGLLYVPFWIAFVSPFAFIWIVAVRTLRLRSGIAPTSPLGGADESAMAVVDASRSRRLVLITGGIIAAYGAFVAVLPLLLYDDLRPPWWLQRPAALFGLLCVPAVIAAIGAIRGSRPLVIAAGVVGLLQSYVAFSGVTLGFVVPALVLLVLGGAERWPGGSPFRRADGLVAVLVIGLTVGAWVSLFAFTAPRCWVGVIGADGTLTTTEVPTAGRISVTDGITSGSGSATGIGPIAQGGEGCSSAELTPTGLAVSAVLAIGAVALAATAAATRPKAMDPA